MVAATPQSTEIAPAHARPLAERIGRAGNEQHLLQQGIAPEMATGAVLHLDPLDRAVVAEKEDLVDPDRPSRLLKKGVAYSAVG